MNTLQDESCKVTFGPPPQTRCTIVGPVGEQKKIPGIDTPVQGEDVFFLGDTQIEVAPTPQSTPNLLPSRKKIRKTIYHVMRVQNVDTVRQGACTIVRSAADGRGFVRQEIDVGGHTTAHISSRGVGGSGHGYSNLLHRRRGGALTVNKLTFTIRASDSAWHPELPGRPLFPN